MLGFKWRSTDRKDGSHCTPVFVEKKYGVGAYDGKSGIAEHIAHLNGILGDPAKKATLNLTIADQFRQLNELGLDPKEYDLRFFVASFAGYGMHEACMLTLDQFRTHLKSYPHRQMTNTRRAPQVPLTSASS